jgi:phage tail-like protein
VDVNGTRFHLLLGRDDWLPAGAAPEGAAWNDEAGALELARLPFVFPHRGAEAPPAREARRGAGRDRFGNWYWVSDDGRGIAARSPRDAAPRVFWPHPPAPADDAGGFAPAAPPPGPEGAALGGLAVTADHYLVAGMTDPAGLLVFDLAAGGPPVALLWPAGADFVPRDLAPAPDGGVWVLDPVHGRLWSLDRFLRVRAPGLPAPAEPPPPDFLPVAGGGADEVADEAAGPVTSDAAVPLGAVVDPVAVEALPDGSALVLAADPAAGAPVLHRYTLDGAAGTLPLAPLVAGHRAVAESLPHGHDLAFVPAPGAAPGDVEGTLFVAAPGGNQAYAFAAALRGGALEAGFDLAFYPMRRFGGRAIVAASGEVHYDSGGRWVSLLDHPRHSYAAHARLRFPAAPPAEGGTAAFDGREPGCVWHRLFLDACIPPGASVAVESRAADSRAELDAVPWQPEPRPYLRAGGLEIPWTRATGSEDAPGAGSWELLFQAARGRYLQLRLTLRGNGRSTPRLQALRAYYPRFSYLREYLPAAWREDPGSASFVDRYLANVEGIFTEVEGRIAAAQVLLDTRTVPAEFLEWLGGWLGASLDAAWDEPKRRFFLANALRIYAGRGTRAGLVRALRLALEPCADASLLEPCAGGCAESRTSPRFTVRVEERFLARTAPGVAYAEAGAPVPGAVRPGAAWTPAHGAEALHARWRAWLAGRYAAIEALDAAWGTSHESFADHRIRLSAMPPAGAAADDWRRFVAGGIGFTYAIPTVAELPLWREFLARRHATPGDLNRAWRRSGPAAYASFDAVPFPDSFPASGAELADWIAFVSGVLPMRRQAHRFTVLVPVELGDPPAVQRERRALAERVAALEKPAHTVVETRLYWAAFTVGGARVGHDTVLGLGSRFTPMVLGGGELASAHLGWTEPWNATGRGVVGRDPVAVRPRTRGTPARCT